MQFNVIAPYVNLLDRFPDRDAYFHMKDTKEDIIETKLVESTEFKNKHKCVITFLYKAYLGREPDDCGLQTYKNFSFSKLRSILINSDEFKKRYLYLKTKFEELYNLDFNNKQFHVKALLAYGNTTLSKQIQIKFIYICSNNIYKDLTFINYDEYTEAELNPKLLKSEEINDYRSDKYEFNPSIVKFNKKTVWGVRRILHNDKPVIWSNIDSNNSKCAGEITIYEENNIVFTQKSKPGKFFMNGWEDIKLFANNENLYALVNFRDENNTFKYCIFIFDTNYKLLKQCDVLTDNKYIENLDQKNWNMFFHEDKLKFQIMIQPSIIGYFDTKENIVEIEEIKSPNNILNCYSNNCICLYENNNRLAIIHKQIRENNKLVYIQRFVIYNENCDIISISKPFKLYNSNIEFPMGMLYDANKQKLIVSFGIADSECKFVSIDHKHISSLFGSLGYVKVQDTSFSMFLHDSNDYISETITRFNCWEPELSNLVYSICNNKKESLVIDIGANIGYYSLLCASLGHKVIAFEPMPFNNALLNMSTDYNNFNIKVICDAISDKHNIMSMNFNPSNKGGCSLREDFDENSTNKNDITQQIANITCKPFNEFTYVNEQLKLYENILFLKIDVEGYETKVFSTLVDLFEKKLVLNCMIEISPDFSSCYDYSLLIYILVLQKYNVYDVNAVLQGQTHKFTKEKLNFKSYKSICDFVRNLQLKPDRQTNLLFSVS